MQFDQLRRREFITLLGSAAATWPLAARAQQAGSTVRRIGFLLPGGPRTTVVRGQLEAFNLVSLGPQGHDNYPAREPQCAGIALGFVVTGAGNPAPRGPAQVDAELRALIWRMSVDNRLWDAPHIHGELLKLGFAVAQSTVSRGVAHP